MNFLVETTNNTAELFRNTFTPNETRSFAHDKQQSMYMDSPNSNLVPDKCNGINVETNHGLTRFEDCKTKRPKKVSALENQKHPRPNQKTERKQIKSTARSKLKVTNSDYNNTTPDPGSNNPPSSDFQPKQPKKRGPKKKPLTKEREARLKNRRVRANARERTRMHSLNHALELLRNHVPTFSTTQRLSKIETLRLAKNYIRTLSELLVKETPPSPLEMALSLTEGLSQNTSNLIASTLQVSPRALIQLQRQINPHGFLDYTTDNSHNSTYPAAHSFTPEWASESNLYTNYHPNSSTCKEPQSLQSPLLISPHASITPPITSQTPPNYPLPVIPIYAKPSNLDDARFYASSWTNSYPRELNSEFDIGPTDFPISFGQIEQPSAPSFRRQQDQHHHHHEDHHHQHQTQQLQQQQQERHPYQSPIMLDNFQPLCMLPLTHSIPR